MSSINGKERSPCQRLDGTSFKASFPAVPSTNVLEQLVVKLSGSRWFIKEYDPVTIGIFAFEIGNGLKVNLILGWKGGASPANFAGCGPSAQPSRTPPAEVVQNYHFFGGGRDVRSPCSRTGSPNTSRAPRGKVP